MADYTDALARIQDRSDRQQQEQEADKRRRLEAERWSQSKDLARSALNCCDLTAVERAGILASFIEETQRRYGGQCFDVLDDPKVLDDLSQSGYSPEIARDAALLTVAILKSAIDPTLDTTKPLQEMLEIGEGVFETLEDEIRFHENRAFGDTSEPMNDLLRLQVTMQFLRVCDLIAGDTGQVSENDDATHQDPIRNHYKTRIPSQGAEATDERTKSELAHQQKLFPKGLAGPLDDDLLVRAIVFLDAFRSKENTDVGILSELFPGGKKVVTKVQSRIRKARGAGWTTLPPR